MKKITAVLIMVLCMFIAAAVAGGPAYAGSFHKAADDSAMKKLAEDNNRFALDIFRRLSNETDESENIFISPYSISSALAMTYLGARGETATEMAKALSFNMEPNHFHSAFNALIRHLNGLSAKGCQLSTANRLWGEKSYNFRDIFLKKSSMYYGAGLVGLDFVSNAENARLTINAWVEKMTGGKIKDLLAKGMVDSSTALVLTNAIYFKGDWQKAFEEKNTRKRPFNLSKGGTVQADMMHRTDTLDYSSADGIQAVKLPYKGNTLSMVILLSEKNNNPQPDGAVLKNIMENFSHQKVALALPKFKTSSTFSLSPVLEKMGMVKAFSAGKADFSGISESRDLYISKVVHKAFVALDETGTEAAAATAVVMSRSVNGGKVIPFIADRPFTFLITDNRSGQILFMGRIANPTK